jgi:prepilin-type processing-associated H-X9-DG protein
VKIVHNFFATGLPAYVKHRFTAAAPPTLPHHTVICYTTRFSSRHSSDGDITFSDGHVSYFKYTYAVKSDGKDPGDPDINWTCDGSLAN